MLRSVAGAGAEPPFGRRPASPEPPSIWSPVGARLFSALVQSPKKSKLVSAREEEEEGEEETKADDEERRGWLASKISRYDSPPSHIVPV